MSSKFTTLGKIGKYGRYGYFTTRRGKVYTPTFMPDGTRGVVKSLLPEQVAGTGVQVILANTYHLHLQPGEKVVNELGGLHAFGGWQGPILTDSGGFQVFSLGKNRNTDSALRSVSVRPGSTEQGVEHYSDASTGLGKPKMIKRLAVSGAPHLSRQAGAGFVKVTEEGVTFKHPITGEKRLITPESSMQIQLDLGADMLVAFDHLIGLDKTSKEEVKDAFERTHRWLERCIKEFNRLTKDLPDTQPSYLDAAVDLFSSNGVKRMEKYGEMSSRRGKSADAPKSSIKNLGSAQVLKDEVRGLGKPILFGVVQGGLDLELRKKSLEIVQASDVGGIAIGGLSVGEGQKAMFKVLTALAPLHDPDRPRFLLGVGEPADLRFAYEHGIDMADCVLPTRNARHATVFVKGDKKLHLTNSRYISDSKAIMPGCDCFTCAGGYSRAFLRHQFKVGEPLAGSMASIHNLRYLERMCQEYRGMKSAPQRNNLSLHKHLEA